MHINYLQNSKVENTLSYRKEFFLICLQLALVCFVANVYEIQDRQGLPLLLNITLPVFLLHSFIPLKGRPLLLTVLFWITCLWSFSWITGGFIILTSLALFVCAELPVKFIFRILLITCITSAMIILRNQWFFAPRAIIAVPYIASLFMFRMVSYLFYKNRNIEPAPLFQRLNYFFLLPNLVFLLFPIIDYKNYITSYYLRPSIEIYRKGMLRINMGVLLLILHRAVYYYWSIPPGQVHDLTTLIGYNLISYFLIIQVVGMFQICVGWVTLFGYDLSDIFENFFLAKGFSELWRKINHYWRDFIVTTFYFPLFFRIRNIGQYKAMAIIGMTSFFISWMLHSQQLYWITGHFSFVATDGIYWLTMGALITSDGIYQYHSIRKKKHPARSIGFNILVSGLRITAILFLASFLWTLWNADNLSSWIFIMKQGLKSGGLMKDLGSVGLLMLIILIAGTYVHFFQKPAERKRLQNERVVYPVISSVIFASLLLLQYTGKIVPASSKLSVIADQIQEGRINEGDQEKVDLGYYDQVTDVGGISRTGTQFLLLGDPEWGRASGATHPTGDIMLREFIPNSKVVHHGYHLNINHMGLRDKEYTDVKPAQTVRFAFCGGSYVLGPGVEKEATFEALVEEHLNDSLKKSDEKNLEILNFSNGGYLLPQMVMLCQKKIFRYSPDYVFYFAHPGELAYTPKNISRLLSFGVDISAFPEVQDIVNKTGLKQSSSRLEMTTKMAPYQEKLLRWGYKRISDQCKEHNARPVWVFLPITTDGDTQAEFLRISKIAREYDFIILDLSNVYRSMKTSVVEISESDSHPNVLGHKLIAAKLEDEIRKKILLTGK